MTRNVRVVPHPGLHVKKTKRREFVEIHRCGGMRFYGPKQKWWGWSKYKVPRVVCWCFLFRNGGHNVKCWYLMFCSSTVQQRAWIHELTVWSAASRKHTFKDRREKLCDTDLNIDWMLFPMDVWNAYTGIYNWIGENNICMCMGMHAGLMMQLSLMPEWF